MQIKKTKCCQKPRQILPTSQNTRDNFKPEGETPAVQGRIAVDLAALCGQVRKAMVTSAEKPLARGFVKRHLKARKTVCF